MKFFLSLLAMVCLLSCSKKEVNKQIDEAYVLLDSSYIEFRAGHNELSKSLANEVLLIGTKLDNDTLTGDALTNLSRNALRDNDADAINDYGNQLRALANKTNDKTWLMIESHMRAELARMNGELDKAAELYDISLDISKSIGSRNMYWSEHFNKSFVEVARGNISEARNLIKKCYQMEMGDDDDAYGLIAIANILLYEGNLLGATEVSLVARRLFQEENIIPDPADEKPLNKIEETYEKRLSHNVKDSLINTSVNLSIKSILNKYLD